jgi:hypothetical protein
MNFRLCDKRHRRAPLTDAAPHESAAVDISRCATLRGGLRLVCPYARRALKFLLYLLAAILPKTRQQALEEERQRREDPGGLRAWIFGIVLLVLVAVGLYSWISGVDADLDPPTLLTAAVVVALLIGLVVIIGAIARFFGAESSDEAPRALADNNGCAVILLIVLILIGLMVLVSKIG